MGWRRRKRNGEGGGVGGVYGVIYIHMYIRRQIAVGRTTAAAAAVLAKFLARMFGLINVGTSYIIIRVHYAQIYIYTYIRTYTYRLVRVQRGNRPLLGYDSFV